MACEASGVLSSECAPSGLQSESERKKKTRRCFLCWERTTITVPETAPSVRASVTCARRERRCCWTCVFCSAACPLDPQPQQARSASEKGKGKKKIREALFSLWHHTHTKLRHWHIYIDFSIPGSRSQGFFVRSFVCVNINIPISETG